MPCYNCVVLLRVAAMYTHISVSVMPDALVWTRHPICLQAFQSRKHTMPLQLQTGVDLQTLAIPLCAFSACCYTCTAEQKCFTA